MTLPDGVTLEDGRTLLVTERGYFARLADGSVHFTACMFAALAMLLANAGIVGSFPRKKRDTPPENFVAQLQRAGDPTPKDGSTIEQSRTALRKLVPDAPILDGSLTLNQIVMELVDDTAIRFILNCGVLPKGYLKRWIGQSYNGGHAVVVSGIRLTDGGDVEIFWMDPMAKPWINDFAGEWIALKSVLPAMKRLKSDPTQFVVTLARRDAAIPEGDPG